MRKALSNLLKVQFARSRWGTLSSTDLELIDRSSWIMVIRASYIQKFTKVFSGHYHTRSDDGRIYLLGNPYEMFWNDVGDRRGFTIFDTETLEHVPVDNPYRLFYNIYYEDTPHQTFDAREYEIRL